MEVLIQIPHCKVKCRFSTVEGEDDLKPCSSRETNIVATFTFLLFSCGHVWLFATLWPHHIRFLCPPLSPRVYSNPCLLSRWCYLTISSSAFSFSFCLQPFSALGSFPMNHSSHQVAKALELSNSLSSEYSELISFGIHWFDPLVGQGTPKSLLQHHNSKTSILQHAAFLVQLSHLYMTPGKNSS